MTDPIPTGLAGLVLEAKDVEAKLEAMEAAPTPAPAAPLPTTAPNAQSVDAPATPYVQPNSTTPPQEPAQQSGPGSPVTPTVLGDAPDPAHPVAVQTPTIVPTVAAVPAATDPVASPPLAGMVISDVPIPVPGDPNVIVPTPAVVAAAPPTPIVSPALDALAKDEARIAVLEADKQAFYQRVLDAKQAGLPATPVPQPIPERILVQTQAEMAAGAAAVAVHAEAQGRRIITPQTPRPGVVEPTTTPVFVPGSHNEYAGTFKSPAQTVSKDSLTQPKQPG
jgi:hypothetical protein